MAGNMVKEMTMNFGKLDKFKGHDFRRWQKKMHFLLTTLKVVYVLTTPMPTLMEDDTVEAIRRRAKCENDDYICRGHILNEDASSKKFLKDFKHTLKHGKDNLSLVQLGSHLHIEESLRAQESDKGKGKEVVGPFVNMTEEGVVKRTTKMLVVRERGLRTNPKTKTYEPVKDGSVLYMGDDHFAPVHGKGSVALEFSFGKTITLFNVLYVPKLRKNLVCGPMLNKCGYKQVYESDKYILSKSGVSVGFGYYNNGHVHYKRMLEMYKDDLILVIDENPEKYRYGEYYDPVFFQSVRIIHETTAPYTPQQNGVAERKNRALKEMLNSMLSYSGLSQGFWGESMLTACYLLNRVPNKRNKTTPYELWYKKRPNLLFLRVWGCRAVVRLSDPKRKTLGEKGIDCIFVGYAEHSKAYRFYVIEPNDSVSINSIIKSRDAIFDENRFSSIPRPKDIIPNSVESQRDDHSDDVPSETLEPRRGKRARKAKLYGSDFYLYLVEGSRDQVGSQYSYCYSIEEDPRTIDEPARNDKSHVNESNYNVSSIDVSNTEEEDAEGDESDHNEEGYTFENNDDDGEFDDLDSILLLCFINLRLASRLVDPLCALVCLETFKTLPRTYNEAMQSRDAAFWKEAIDDEIGSIMENNTWVLSDLPPGFRQKEGINYFDTYAPVARITTIRLLFALAAIHNLVIHQMDVKTIFLNGDLDEEVYMRQPKGFVMPEAYSDASWINHVEDSSSTSGWVFLLGGGAISWASKKQTCITGSTMESEFVALAAAGKEAEWLRNLIHEIPIWPKPIAPISIHCDSAATLAKAYSQMYNGKSRHLGVRHSMIRELIMNGVISIEFVRSQQNLADHLTKGLARDLVNKSVIGMGLKSI
ncbi:zinc finger, CCHC-type containing protein [Tanacetum coccineum]|uniref:Zinc finger, CCHC-type containing protein n=1 Tax=Tanacetum coccineum TaxID=301880 RepID=A0ABQ4Y7G4_9ASTR